MAARHHIQAHAYTWFQRWEHTHWRSWSPARRCEWSRRTCLAPWRQRGETRWRSPCRDHSSCDRHHSRPLQPSKLALGTLATAATAALATFASCCSLAHAASTGGTIVGTTAGDTLLKTNSPHQHFSSMKFHHPKQGRAFAGAPNAFRRHAQRQCHRRDLQQALSPGHLQPTTRRGQMHSMVRVFHVMPALHCKVLHRRADGSPL